MCAVNLCKNDDIINNRILPVGKPSCNYKIFILDNNLKPVPIGVEGEIFVGGRSVSKRYLNLDKLTKEKFIRCPFKTNLDEFTLFRTGDFGKWTKDGEVIHLGRKDSQVKIRGIRIEMNEIENSIRDIDEITDSVVVDKIKPNGEKYLIGLPEYMIPSYFIKIDKIPLNSRGKLDRSSLPEPKQEDYIKETYIAPETDIEKIVCKIYSDIFNIPLNKIGRMHNFYELGGDSLNVNRVSTCIEKKLKIKVYIKDIMSHPMICELSKYIESIMNDEKSDRNKMEEISKCNSKEFPITSQQLGVYLDSIKDVNSLIYNLPSFYKLNENIDKEKIKNGFLKIFEKQEILRSRYAGKEINGETEIYGFIDDECSLKFEEYSYDNIKTFVRPFDLNKAPLIRVGFINDEVLLIDMHHLICDGSTMSIIIDELNKYYNGEKVEELEIQYSDYAINLNEKKNNGKLNEQIKIYKEIFSNEYEILNIQKKNMIMNDEDYNKDVNKIENIKENHLKSNSYEQVIDKSKSKIINEFIKHHNISKTAFFISIYGYVLSKYSGQDIIYTSVMSANRNNHYVENMAGMFISTLPLLLKYENEEKRFVEIIKENMEMLINIYNNQDISFAELTEIIKLKKINNSFIFQPKAISQNNIKKNKSIFSVNDNENNTKIFNSLLNENTFKQNNNSKFDITFYVEENEDDYLLSIEYNTLLYDSIMIKNILNSYIEVINNIQNLENIGAKDIEYIPLKEKERILYSFNSNTYEYTNDKLYHVEFMKVAKNYLNNDAIINNNVRISYKKLNEMSNSLGNYLRSKGVKRNDIIPIISERSYYFVVAILGIMKSGAAYLPIDPDFPKDRIDYMVKEAKSKLIMKYISDEENEKKLNDIDIPIYSLKDHDYQLNTEDVVNINKGDDLCYVLFTSGTTGKPKGTLISHSNLINYCLYSQTFNGKGDLYGNELGNVLCICKFSHDISIGEINYPLLMGKKIILSNDEEFNNPKLLSSLITKYDVNFIFAVPSRIKVYLFDVEFLNSIKNVKWILLGGEKADLEIISSIQNNSEYTNVLSVYGPTETSVVSNIKILDRSISKNIKFNPQVTVGKPLCNFKMYILDKYMKPVPVGVVGEIYIGGYGVGDLGKWTEEGEIVCCGRIDFQVKIRGQRIELNEIEN
eukprot:jgi/Orpsp1_1/1188897/evm.model.d7180000068019.1